MHVRCIRMLMFSRVGTVDPNPDTKPRDAHEILRARDTVEEQARQKVRFGFTIHRAKTRRGE